MAENVFFVPAIARWSHIHNNATVDWSKRSDVRAKLRLTVRKILIKYGYPPDLARMEADRVIEQSEVMVESFTN